MTPGEFIEVSDTIAEAPGGIERLRELVLQLAVRGKLVHQDADEEPASVLLERIADEKFWLFGEGKLRMPKPLHPIATEEAPFEIPDHWEWVCLGDIANSRLRKMLDKSKNKGPYRRYLRNANVQWFRFDLSDVLELRLEDTELEEYSVKENDLIVCEGGEPGRAAICGPDVDGMVFQKALHRVRPWCGISTWYLAYLLRCDTWSQRINTLFTGATIKHLTGKALATHMVPLPPLSEQYRIVAKIDELMRLIDRLAAARRSREAVRTAGRDSALAALCNAATSEEVKAAWTRIADRKDDLFTAPADLTPLREAVFQLAVRGRLVPQDEDEEPAGKLVAELEAGKERLLVKEIITKPRYPYGVPVEHEPFEIPETWQWLRLGDVGAIVGGGTPRSGESSFWSDGQDIPWLTPADMRRQPSRYISRGERDITSEGLSRSSAQMLPASSVLFSSRAPIGHVGIAANPLCTNQGFKSCVPYIPAMSDYLYVFLKYAGPDIDAQATGTTFKEVAGKEIALVPVPIAPLAEQHRIVAKVDELMDLIDRLEQHLVAKEGIQGDFVVALSKRVEATIQ